MPDPPIPTNGQPLESLRSRLGTAAQQVPELDALIQIVADACKPAKKHTVRGHQCERCGTNCPHHFYVMVHDAKAARETLAFVMEQLEGRPGVADGLDAGVVVHRVVVGLEPDKPFAPVEASHANGREAMSANKERD